MRFLNLMGLARVGLCALLMGFSASRNPIHKTHAVAHAANNGIWKVETVDRSRATSDGTGGLLDPSLALDATGKPHLAYNDSPDGILSRLLYAQKTNSVWITKTIDATAGEKPALVFGKGSNAGNRYIGYTLYDGDVWRGFAQSTNGVAWTTQITTFASTATQPVLDVAAAPNGQVFAMYGVRATGNYFLRMGVQQTTTLVFNAADELTGSNPHLVTDALNRVHLSYRDTISGKLNYGLRTTLGFVPETVGDPDTLNFAIVNDIAVDVLNNPHIAFSNQLKNELIYAKKVNGVWTREKVATHVADASIAIDSTGQVHLAYIENFPRNIVYAVRSGNTWLTKTINADEAISLAFALDAQDRPFIAYTDFDTGNLKLAYLARPFYLPVIRR